MFCLKEIATDVLVTEARYNVAFNFLVGFTPCD